MDWMHFGKMLVIIFGFFGVGFIMINLRHIIKGEEFRGTCASSNPALKDDDGGCSMCGAKPNEVCQAEGAA